MTSSISLNLTLLGPEIVLFLTAAVILIVSLWKTKEKYLILGLSLAGIVLSFICLLNIYSVPSQSFFSEMLSHDPFALFFKIIFLVVAAIIIIFSLSSYEIKENERAEFYILVIFITVGMSLLVSSINLLMIYLALEMVSIPSYILAGYRKENYRSNEAALKYMIYGAISSGLMLYGMSFLYGLTRSLNIYTIYQSLQVVGTDVYAVYFILILILAGFAYKISAVPLHMWAPDVYEGAPTPATAFFSVAPKAAGFAILIRFFYVVFASQTGDSWVALKDINWPIILSIISAITMTVGNLSALSQKNAKRMLAYSSIAHAGYILMGFIVLNKEGLAAILFYFVIYLLMNLGAFITVGLLGEHFKGEEIDDYKGLGWQAPVVAGAFTIFLFSLTGIPPFGGFIGKVYLFAALIHKEIYWLVVVGILNSVISLFYYARIVKAMFLEHKDVKEETPQVSLVLKVVVIVLAVPTLFLGVYWEPVMNWVQSSLKFIGG